MSECSVKGCDAPARARGLCNRHYLRAWNDGTLDLVVPLPSTEERFWSRVEVRGECWMWAGARDPMGYGRFRDRGRTSSTVLAHRLAYEMRVGPIPPGLVIDHLCRNPSCVNPDHLEPVTNAENVRRGNAGYNRNKTECVHGHPFDEANTAVYYGKRVCRTCRRNWGREYDRRRRTG